MLTIYVTGDGLTAEYIHVCMHTCIHTNTHTYTSIHDGHTAEYIHVCIHSYIHIRTYMICTCTDTHIRICIQQLQSESPAAAMLQKERDSESVDDVKVRHVCDVLKRDMFVM